MAGSVIHLNKMPNDQIISKNMQLLKKHIPELSYPSRLLSLERERSFLRSPERERCDLERLLRLLLRDLCDLQVNLQIISNL